MYIVKTVSPPVAVLLQRASDDRESARMWITVLMVAVVYRCWCGWSVMSWWWRGCGCCGVDEGWGGMGVVGLQRHRRWKCRYGDGADGVALTAWWSCRKQWREH